MRHFGRKEEVHEALSVLGKQMALVGAEDIRLLCCGGSALCVLELISRSTKDVDALGVIVDGPNLKPIEGFSAEMERAIAQTADRLGLESDWLNGEASVLLERGLPEGILERATEHARHYGPCLTVAFIARLDQVALKLSAAMDLLKGRRHVEDLVEMGPTQGEIQHGLKWLGAWKSNDAFKKRLAFLVEALGFSEMASDFAKGKGA